MAAHLLRPHRDPDIEAILTELDGARARCEQLEEALRDAVKSLAEAIDGHDSREEGSG